MARSDVTAPPRRAVTERAATASSFRGDVEGLRAVALGLVLLFNVGAPGGRAGFVGVDVFFVISGFLITGLLLREVERTGRVSLAAFYARRARRILPSAVFVTVATLAVSAVLLPAARVEAIARDALAATLQVANFWFASFDPVALDPAISDSPLLHYWSLAVEEQFYLVWPLTVIAVVAWVRRRHGLDGAGVRGGDWRRVLVVVTAVLAAVSLLLSVVVTARWELLGYLSSPTRAWQLGAGALLALAAPALGRWAAEPWWPRASLVAGWAGFLAIGTSSLWVARLDYPGFVALVPILGAVAVIAAGSAAGTAAGAREEAVAVRRRGGLAAVASQLTVTRFLSLAPIRFAGRLSYVWYLWHHPVVFWAIELGVTGWVPLLAVELATGVLAWATVVLVERPLRFSPLVAASPQRGLVLGAVCTAVGVLTALAFTA